MRCTRNPGKKYPPNAVLRCQQSPQCSARIVVGKDTFYHCRSRTNYHCTKDGRFVICNKCALSTNAKEERMRRNQQLLKRLAKIDQHHQESASHTIANTSHNVLKEGYMMKRGNAWSSSFKKRYFVLFESKQLYYYSRCRDGTVSYQRGVADLSNIQTVSKKDGNGLDVVTQDREWRFKCPSRTERDDWYHVFSSLKSKY